MLKRVLDLAGAGLGLCLFAPAMLLIAAAIRIMMGSPVLYQQERPGLHGNNFRMLKFRTMTCGRDGRGNLLTDERRLTRLGSWLRATSLDELPELVNVLRGEMSLVGPRPLLVEYLPHYSPEQARRHDVKPGITGWAQVNGRNALTWEEKFALDVWYVDHQSLRMDVWILLLTLWRVLRREGITPSTRETIEKFHGSAEPHSSYSRDV